MTSEAREINADKVKVLLNILSIEVWEVGIEFSEGKRNFEQKQPALFRLW